MQHVRDKCETEPLYSTEKSTIPVCTISPAPATHLGCVRGFIHKVQVNTTVQPVRPKLRHLPLSIRNEVSTELVESPKGPFQHMARDIIGPFKWGTNERKFAIALIDYFSKKSRGRIRSFSDSRHDREVPDTSLHEMEILALLLLTMVSDFADFMRVQGIKHIKTSVYQPPR